MKFRLAFGLVSVLAITSSSTANATDRPFTFEQIYLSHKTTEYYGVKTPVLTGSSSLGAWCRNNSQPIESLATFEVATYVVAQPDGLYDCKGQFALQLGENTLIAYKFASCTPVDPVELRKTCPTPAP